MLLNCDIELFNISLILIFSIFVTGFNLNYNHNQIIKINIYYLI